MKYSVAVMLLIGAMSTAEALNLESQNTGFLQADMDQEVYNNEISASDKQATKESVAEAQKKAQEAAKKAQETKQKIEDIKAKQKTSSVKPITKTLQKVMEPKSNATLAAKPADKDPKSVATEKV